MKKDAYYFPHFSNARNDQKLVKLRRVMGIEGYGMYFMLLEVLRDQTDFKYPLKSLEDIAYDWHTSKEKLFAVVSNFDLFTVTNDLFFSPKMITFLQPYLEKTERARSAALKRWGNANALNGDANALQMESNCSANQNASKVKESKVKESKVNKEYEPEICNFVTSILKYFPTRVVEKTNLEKWFECADKLTRIDNYDLLDIEEIIKFARNDDFWSKNFLSITKLREKNKAGISYMDYFTELKNANKSKLRNIYEPNKDIRKDPNRLKF